MSDFVVDSVNDTFVIGNDDNPELQFDGEFSPSGAKLRAAPAIEPGKIYCAKIASLGDDTRRVRTLEAREGKAPVRILPFRLQIFQFAEDGSFECQDRWLNDIWVVGAHNNEPADFGKFFALCTTALGANMPLDEHSDPLIDDEHSINWYISQLLEGAPLRVKSGTKTYKTKGGEERTNVVFYIHSPWPEGNDL